MKTLRIGHPLLVEEGATEAPALDFGSLINNRKVEELRGHVADALSKGAVQLYKAELDESPVPARSGYIGLFAAHRTAGHAEKCPSVLQ